MTKYYNAEDGVKIRTEAIENKAYVKFPNSEEKEIDSRSKLVVYAIGGNEQITKEEYEK
jgi:hypothetical protein